MPARPPTSRRRRFPGRRGSALLAALLFAALLGLILASHAQLARTSLELAQRSLWTGAALNLAENGLEEAVYALNQQLPGSSFSWADAGWTLGDGDAWRKWTDLPVDGAARGEIRVRVYQRTGESAPLIVARGLVYPPVGMDAPPVEKWIRVQTRRAARHAHGLVTRGNIRFAGDNAVVDSWISRPDSGGFQPYVPGVARDQASMGSLSVAVDAVAVQNARIWGYVATGGSPPVVGSVGSIGPFGTASGVVNPAHVSTYFLTSLPPGYNPKNTSGFTAVTTLGTQPAPGKYRLQQITLSGEQKLTIAGNVEIMLTQFTGRKAVDLSGNAAIILLPGASLTLYAQGDLNLGGQGIVNQGATAATAGPPASLQIQGMSATGTSTQKIAIGGSAVFSGALYAPSASVTVTGDADVLGSMVANDITFSGNARFHQDESLAQQTATGQFGLGTWNELGGTTDRAPYLADLSF